MARATVAILRAQPEQILGEIERVLALAELPARVAAATAVHLVPCPAALPYPTTSTTPWQVEGALRALRAFGAGAVTCEPVPGDPVLAAVLAAYEIPVSAEPEAGALRLVLPRLRCDAGTTLAGAALLAAGAPAFALVDGTTVGAGPRAERPVVKGVLLGSAAPVALDAVAAEMLGFEPAGIAHLVAAGLLPRADIAVVGEPALAAQRWGFAIGERFVDRLRARTAGGRLANLVALGAEAYRELRWPLRDRAVFDEWRDGTAWGRLYDRYVALGALATGPSPTPSASPASPRSGR